MTLRVYLTLKTKILQLKIRILEDNNMIRVYHSPHEVIVRPGAKIVEVFDEDGTADDTYNLVDRKLSWLEDADSDSSEIVLDLHVKR
ncbi:hypothetical protein [Nitrosopumilus sp.]|uniref:hypothetical protein n=1 Tax=Nitrosopumilus sp. TaxID=2024843 RepID=UPI00292D1FCC|nr:hypothetical protein [Nitrosopumilus sp.]